MARSYETIRVGQRGVVAWITFDRPETMNSMSPQMVDEIGAALDELASDGRTRCVVLTGAGRAFCAGADLKAVKSLGDAGAQEGAMRAFLAAAGSQLRRIELLPLPVIAAVNGLALAGGLETVLVCDLVVAADSAKFGDAHSKYGLLPGWAGSARLPQDRRQSRPSALPAPPWKPGAMRAPATTSTMDRGLLPHIGQAMADIAAFIRHLL